MSDFNLTFVMSNKHRFFIITLNCYVIIRVGSRLKKRQKQLSRGTFVIMHLLYPGFIDTKVIFMLVTLRQFYHFYVMSIKREYKNKWKVKLTTIKLFESIKKLTSVL